MSKPKHHHPIWYDSHSLFEPEATWERQQVQTPVPKHNEETRIIPREHNETYEKR